MCNPYFFTVAWFVTLMVTYGHVIILLLTLVIGSSLLIRFQLGQLLNLFIALALYVFLGSFFSFECTIKGQVNIFTGTMTQGEQRHVTILPFPVIGLQLLFFTLTFFFQSHSPDEWRFDTSNKLVYYRFMSLVIFLTLVVTLAYLWFHSIFQIILSMSVGSLVGILWYRFIARYFRFIPAQLSTSYNTETLPDIEKEAPSQDKHL